MEDKNLQIGFNKMLKVQTKVQRKRITKENKKKNLFISMITKYELALTNSMMVQTQYNIDLSKYEEPFYSIIDETFLLSFGEEIYSLIAFYFYERMNIDGTVNPFLLVDGTEIYLKSPNDLYNMINKFFPDTFK